MNTTSKATRALGAAGLSLLALASGASAQTTVGDPTLTTAFSTLTNGRTPTFVGNNSVGVGFDANNGNGTLSSSPTPATAQSVYEAFNFTSSAAGAFTTLAAGSMAQIQVFASNQNVNATNGLTNPFNIYASLYAFNPNAAAGTVPVMGPNLFGAQQKVTVGAINGGYFSGDFTLASSLTAGSSYVLGITTLTGDTQDFAQIATSPFSASGIAAGDQSFDKNKFLTDANDQGNPTGMPFTLTSGNNVIAFRLNAAPATSPVPEASSVVSLGLLLGMGAAFVAFKRRRSVAK